jgi:predicted lipoprotein with Yx(FWY)xxD motif
MPYQIDNLARGARRGVIAVAAVAAFTVGACASPSGAATKAPAAAATTSAAGTTGPAGSAGASVTLAAATDATVGSHVTGANGMSLYIFTPDAGTTSSCVDQCATNWPPLTVGSAADATAGTGVSGTLGTITRPDGSTQVTLGGHPLYYFANDKAAGDLNGQGLNGKWFAAGPDGSGLGMNAAPSPSSDSKPRY